MTDVVLPSLGESVTEGIVTRWFKAVGERVERDEPLYEISTDKVDSEMPAPAGGVLQSILVAEGDTAAVGATLAVIGDGAAAPAPPADAVRGATGTAPAPPVAPQAAAPEVTAPVEPASRDGREAPVASPVADATVTSPVVRRILEDAGLDAARVTGSGPGGTVTRRDAERAVLQRPTVEELVPLSKVRRRMAEHMSAAAGASPQGFVAIEADARAIASLRELGGTTLDGTRVEPATVVAVAVVRALGEFELLNATLADDGLVVHHSVNLGIVLGTDDGMLVPVIHAAAGLTLRALAKRVADLRERTSTRQLTTDDLLGATFTIAGPPTDEVLFSVPVLIQPQVAIVSVGAPRPHVVLGTDGVEVHERIVLGCAFDHRVVEATYVARFLGRVASLLGGLDVASER